MKKEVSVMDETRPTTQAGRAMSADNIDCIDLDGYGYVLPDDWDERIAAIEAEARAEADTTIAALTAPHKRSEPQDYDPTPACVYCHKAWDEGGNYLPEYRCPYSPAALADTAAAAEEARQRIMAAHFLTDEGKALLTVIRTTAVSEWLASPEAERRLAEALTNLVFASSATRTERARAILAALRGKP